MKSITLLVCVLTASTVFAEAPPPKAAYPNYQKSAEPAVTVVLVRPMTLGERILERRAARLADQVVRLREMRARPVVLRVFAVGGGCSLNGH